MLSNLVPVDDASRVGEIRRLAVTAARSEGLNEQACEEVAIIATEIASNLVKHARSGEVQITRLSQSGPSGVEILSIDGGPGMLEWRDCLADGFSTSGTPGTGLGAVSRLSDVFDLYSQAGKGTVLVARRLSEGPSDPLLSRWNIGTVVAPYPGEAVCGDAWGVRSSGGGLALIVADGLGHGLLASDASTAAVRTFWQSAADSIRMLLEEVHLALRHTRGAAVAISLIESSNRNVRFAGLGNITGVLLGGVRPQFMTSHNGTAGLGARTVQEFAYNLPAEGVIVMHSDGLSTSWTIDAYPGLIRRHPSIIAGVLYRDASRRRDDSCVLVARSSAS